MQIGLFLGTLLSAWNILIYFLQSYHYVGFQAHLQGMVATPYVFCMYTNSHVLCSTVTADGTMKCCVAVAQRKGPKDESDVYV